MPQYTPAWLAPVLQSLPRGKLLHLGPYLMGVPTYLGGGGSPSLVACFAGKRVHSTVRDIDRGHERAEREAEGRKLYQES
jgi:hypothetical protein